MSHLFFIHLVSQLLLYITKLMNQFTKISITLIILFTIAKSGIAQNPDIKRTYHWHFGIGAGLDFSSGTPVSTTTNPMTVDTLNGEWMEGTASVSDTCGNLLFYTDGNTVWNSNNQIMQNGTGLLGNRSSTQSALIVPQPGNDSIYYIFTTDDDGNVGANGLRYSIVNINLNAGLGAIIQKNVLLYAPAGEKLTATYHANGSDMWILSVNRYPSGPPPDTTYQYYAYLLTAGGINPPIISPSAVHPHKFLYGYIRFSTLGDKVVTVFNTGFQDTLEFRQFDNATGLLYNPIILQPEYYSYGDSIVGGYGLCFSADDSKLYYSFTGFYNDGNEVFDYFSKIYQYDVSVYDSAIISSSKIMIQKSDSTTNLLPTYYALQNGADGYIYISVINFQQPYYPDTIALIANPNLSGAACNFIGNGVAIGGMSHAGLPNFVDSYFNSSWVQGCTTGVSEIEDKVPYKLYPNPANDFIMIESTKSFTIKLFNINGILLNSTHVKHNLYKLDVSSYNNGIYLIQIISNNEYYSHKLIINH